MMCPAPHWQRDAGVDELALEAADDADDRLEHVMQLVLEREVAPDPDLGLRARLATPYPPAGNARALHACSN